MERLATYSKVRDSLKVAVIAISAMMTAIITATTLVVGSTATARESDPSSEGNGTLPARWYGLVQVDGSGATKRATMVLSYIDDLAFLPDEVGCDGFDGDDGRGYVTSGWIQVTEINKFFAINAVCLSQDGSGAELVATDRTGARLHLRGDLANKKFGMTFSGSFVSGPRFVFVEDKRP